MFNRIEFKRSARKQLKSKWALSLFVTFLSLCIFFLFIPTKSKSSLFSIITLIFIAVTGIITNARIKTFFTYARNRENLNISFNLFLLGLEDWSRGIVASFIIYIKCVLWACLLVIPGFVALYKYSLTYFLLADNKTLSAKKAVRLSAILTRGYKADLFLLHLSFLPLIALSLITFGIGFLWTIPYIETATANAYLCIKHSALKQNILDAEDFAGK